MPVFVNSSAIYDFHIYFIYLLTIIDKYQIVSITLNNPQPMSSQPNSGILVKSAFIIIGFFMFQPGSNAQNYDAELVLQKTEIEASKNKLTKSVYYEIRINNRDGEKYTKLSIPYSKTDRINNIEGYIKDSRGKIVKKLKRSEIEERSSISDYSFYEDDFVKEFTLKHNSYPYTIVYSYEIQQDEFMYISYWMPVIDYKIPTLAASLTLTIPRKYKINYTKNHIEMPIIVDGDDVQFQWQGSYTDIVTREAFSPPIYDLLPSVIIVPEYFNYEVKGSNSDWVSYGNWQFELIEGLNELPDFEKNKINTLIKNINDDKEKIKVLYHYLQDETRYINVSIETGGLKPYPAAYVAQNKYGDCKALTYYFKSVMDYIGIKSYYSKVNAGNPIEKIDESFPSQQFNHVILYIPLSNEDIWLDCTSDAAFNFLGTFTQNRNALIVDEDKTCFIKTPALTPSDVLETRRIEIAYAPGRATVHFQNRYKGDKYESILELENSYNKTQRSMIVRNFLIENGYELLNYKISKQERDSVNIQLSFTATNQLIYKHYGNDILISNIPFVLSQIEKPKDRLSPIQIDYPIYKIDTLVYEIPDGYKFGKGVIKDSISSRFGEYSINIQKNLGVIMVIKRILINSGVYPRSDYNDFFRFYSKVAEIEHQSLVSLSK